MKKILLLLLSMSLLFALGCGSGGGSTAQGTLPDTSGGTSPTVSGTGITVNIPAETHAANTIHAAVAVPYPTSSPNWRARLVAIKSTAAGAPCYTYDGTTDSYIKTSDTGCSAILDRRIKDCTLGTDGSGSCSITVTPTSGDQTYRVDVLTYLLDDHTLPGATDPNVDYHIITRYATGNNFTVSQSQQQTAAVAWQSLPALNIPSPAEQGGSYSLAPAITAPFFAGASYVRWSASAITGTFPFTPLPSPASHITLTTKFVADTTASTFLQGQFFIDPSYLQAGEAYQNWVYYDNTHATSGNAITLVTPTTFNIVVP